MRPCVKAVGQSTSSVLTPEEKGQGYFFRHDLSALLKADFLTRMQGYAMMLNTGKNSINEVRGMEGENPIEGGDEHFVQVNQAPLQNMQGATPQSARIRVGASERLRNACRVPGGTVTTAPVP